MGIRHIDLGDGNSVFVEVDDDTVPQETGAFDEHTNLSLTEENITRGKLATNLVNQLSSVGKTLQKAALESGPQKVEIVAQVAFSGATGIPVFVKTKGETSFTIKMTWERPNKV